MNSAPAKIMTSLNKDEASLEQDKELDVSLTPE